MNRRALLGAAASVGAGLLTAEARAAEPVRVLCWSERTEPQSIYPNGINGTVAEFLNKVPGIRAKAVNLSDPEQGITDELLDRTDVIHWFGHEKHALVEDAKVAAIVKRINERGLGFLAQHSSHYSKVLKTALKTSGDLGGGVGNGGKETVYVINPTHPIAKGVKDFTIDQEEFYDEPFGIPQPNELLFLSVFDATRPDGSHRKFRSGACFEVGKGRLFYFRPGHEEYPTLHHPMVQKIVTNAVFWLARKEPA